MRSISWLEVVNPERHFNVFEWSHDKFWLLRVCLAHLKSKVSQPFSDLFLLFIYFCFWACLAWTEMQIAYVWKARWSKSILRGAFFYFLLLTYFCLKSLAFISLSPIWFNFHLPSTNPLTFISLLYFISPIHLPTHTYRTYGRPHPQPRSREKLETPQRTAVGHRIQPSATVCACSSFCLEDLG